MGQFSMVISRTIRQGVESFQYGKLILEVWGMFFDYNKLEKGHGLYVKSLHVQKRLLDSDLMKFP